MIKELLVLHHTHTDVGFTHPPAVWWRLSREFIDSALDLCDVTADYPEESRLIWTCEVTMSVLDWLEHASAAQTARFRSAVERGQIACGAMWCNITPLFSREQMIWSLSHVDELRRRFGLAARVAIQHDVNGVPWPIVDLLNEHGIDGLLMGINVHYGGVAVGRPTGFIWRGPGGGELAVYNGEHYAHFDLIAGLRDGKPQDVATGIRRYITQLEQSGYPFDFAYLTATHPGFIDNNPPNPLLPQLIRDWNDAGNEPTIRFASPEMVIDRLRKQPASLLATLQGDWTDYWNFGCASSALETAVNRETARRLNRFTSSSLLATPSGRERFDEAMRLSCLFNEHTWGAVCSVSSSRPEPVQEQWVQKAHTAWVARSLTGMLVRDELDALAGQRPTARRVDRMGLLVRNSGDAPFTGYLHVPKLWLQPAGYHLQGTSYEIETLKDLWSAPCVTGAEVDVSDTILIGPVTVAPRSHVTLERSKVDAAATPPGLVAGDDRLESPHFKMTFSPHTGQITHLATAADVAVLDAAIIGFPILGYIHEELDLTRISDHLKRHPREAQYTTDFEAIRQTRSGWRSDWPALRRGPNQLESCRCTVEPDGARLITTWSAPGVSRLTRTITLPAERPVIRIELSMDMLDNPNPQSTYLAFPLPLPGWRAWFDTMGCPVEYDAQQLPGACRDYLTAESYLAVADHDRCILIASPDAPMWQPGGFNFAKQIRKVEDRSHAVMLAWLTNNYWSTNARPSQPGRINFRFELSMRCQFDHAESVRCAEQAAPLVDVHPLVRERSGP